MYFSSDFWPPSASSADRRPARPAAWAPSRLPPRCRARSRAAPSAAPVLTTGMADPIRRAVVLTEMGVDIPQSIMTINSPPPFHAHRPGDIELVVKYHDPLERDLRSAPPRPPNGSISSRIWASAGVRSPRRWPRRPAIEAFAPRGRYGGRSRPPPEPHCAVPHMARPGVEADHQKHRNAYFLAEPGRAPAAAGAAATAGAAAALLPGPPTCCRCRTCRRYPRPLPERACRGHIGAAGPASWTTVGNCDRVTVVVAGHERTPSGTLSTSRWTVADLGPVRSTSKYSRIVQAGAHP